MSFGDSSYVQPSAAELAQAQQQLTDWQQLAPVFRQNATASVQRAEAANQRNSMLQGGIGASVSQVMDARRRQANNAMMQQGTAPTSGRFLMGNSGVDRTAGLGRALARGVVNNESAYLTGVGQQIQVGQGLLQGTDAARNAIAGLDTQRGALGVYASNARGQAIGEGIGAAIGMFGTAGGFGKMGTSGTGTKLKLDKGFNSPFKQATPNLGSGFSSNMGSPMSAGLNFNPSFGGV